MTKTDTVSIITPTLNEEKYLPKLLKSIEIQNFSCEIIIADANSTDSTVEIAKAYGCKIIKGGKAAKGRNAGTKAAIGDILLFLDADCVLPAGFLKKSIDEFNAKNFDVASCWSSPLSQHLIDHLVFSFVNLIINLSQRVKPFMQLCIFAKKSIHDKIGGFDESLFFGEDSEYACRASKIGKTGILKSKILVSVRRFEKEGRLKLTFKYLYLNIHRLLKGEIRIPIDYEYGNYK